MGSDESESVARAVRGFASAEESLRAFLESASSLDTARTSIELAGESIAAAEAASRKIVEESSAANSAKVDEAVDSLANTERAVRMAESAVSDGASALRDLARALQDNARDLRDATALVRDFDPEALRQDIAIVGRVTRMCLIAACVSAVGSAITIALTVLI